jgi:hypothetical protein
MWQANKTEFEYRLHINAYQLHIVSLQRSQVWIKKYIKKISYTSTHVSLNISLNVGYTSTHDRHTNGDSHYCCLGSFSHSHARTRALSLALSLSRSQRTCSTSFSSTNYYKWVPYRKRASRHRLVQLTTTHRRKEVNKIINKNQCDRWKL